MLNEWVENFIHNQGEPEVLLHWLLLNPRVDKLHIWSGMCMCVERGCWLSFYVPKNSCEMHPSIWIQWLLSLMYAIIYNMDKPIKLIYRYVCILCIYVSMMINCKSKMAFNDKSTYTASEPHILAQMRNIQKLYSIFTCSAHTSFR